MKWCKHTFTPRDSFPVFCLRPQWWQCSENIAYVQCLRLVLGPLKKLVWLVLSLASVVGVTYSLYLMVDTYLAYKVTTAVEMKAKTQLDFPGVTVCNLNPLRKLAVENYQDFKTALYGDSKRRRKRARKYIRVANYDYCHVCSWRCRRSQTRLTKSLLNKTHY